MLFVGVDHGRKGIVVGNRKGKISFYFKIPFIEDSLDIDAFESLTRKHFVDDDDVFVVVEKPFVTKGVPGRIRGTSPMSAFNLGRSYGSILVVLRSFKLVEAQPSRWKSTLGLFLDAGRLDELSPDKAYKEKKRIAVEKALDIFPGETFILPRGRVPSSDFAEAALLSVYCRQLVLTKKFPEKSLSSSSTMR